MLKCALAVCSDGSVLFAVLLRASLHTGVRGSGEKKNTFLHKFADRGGKNKQEAGKKEKDVEVEFFFFFASHLWAQQNPGPLLICDGDVWKC